MPVAISRKLCDFVAAPQNPLESDAAVDCWVNNVSKETLIIVMEDQKKLNHSPMHFTLSP